MTQEITGQTAERESSLSGLLTQHVENVLIDFDLIPALSQSRLFDRDALKGIGIIGGIMRIPKCRSLFIAGKFLWKRINTFTAVGHNISVLLESSHAQKWVMLLSGP